MWRFRKKTKENPQPASQEDLHCSFCSKRQAQVAKLIAGPKVYICDECVSLCDDILAEEHAKAEPQPEARSEPGAPRRGQSFPPAYSAGCVASRWKSMLAL